MRDVRWPGAPGGKVRGGAGDQRGVPAQGLRPAMICTKALRGHRAPGPPPASPGPRPPGDTGPGRTAGPGGRRRFRVWRNTHTPHDARSEGPCVCGRGPRGPLGFRPSADSDGPVHLQSSNTLQLVAWLPWPGIQFLEPSLSRGLM